MFAVIKTGGKQYRVAPTDVVTIDRLDGAAGDTVAFGEVLVVGGDSGTTLGAPTVAGASVAAEIVEQSRGAKILVFKKRRRQNSERRRGHRQDLTVVRITEILTDGRKAAKAEPAAERAAPAAVAAPAAAAEAPAPVAAAAGGDDLKKLSGVGPVLEKKLHGVGVSRFAEIAAWTPADIARIDESLALGGRIERDDWVGQAKSLMAKD